MTAREAVREKLRLLRAESERKKKSITWTELNPPLLSADERIRGTSYNAAMITILSGGRSWWQRIKDVLR